MATLRKGSGIDRRKNGERFEWENAAVMANFEKGAAEGRSQNLSEGGITMVTDSNSLPSVGDEVILKMESTDGGWIVCEGVCIRIERVGRMGSARALTFRFVDEQGRGFAAEMIRSLRSLERLEDLEKLGASLRLACRD